METRHHSQTAVGVDGCRGGWIAAIRPAGAPVQLQFTPSFRSLLEALPEDATILVDMIHGLPDARYPDRACDSLARALLGRQSSRVFAAPPRETLSTTTYEAACARARRATGKAISKQSWFLLPKIRELDTVFDPRVGESHPELVFMRLNGGVPVAASKKTPEGVAARLRAIEPALPGAHDSYRTACRHLPRKQVNPDDTLDALALCAVAQFPDLLTALPEHPVPFDSCGHPKQIWF